MAAPMKSYTLDPTSMPRPVLPLSHLTRNLNIPEPPLTTRSELVQEHTTASHQLQDNSLLTHFESSGLETFSPTAEDAECLICHDPYIDAVKTRVCGHVFDRECLLTWLRRSRTCPTCRHPLLPRPQDLVFDAIMSPTYEFEDFGIIIRNNIDLEFANLDLLYEENLVSAILNLPADSRVRLRADVTGRALVLAGNVALEMGRVQRRELERGEFVAMVRAMFAYVRERDGEMVNVRMLPSDLVAGTIRIMRDEGWEVRETPMVITNGGGDGAEGRMLRMVFLVAWVAWRAQAQGAEEARGGQGREVNDWETLLM